MRFHSLEIIPPGTKIDFVGKRNIALALSLILNLAVIVWSLPAVHGLNFGVDFAGGTEMELRFAKTVDPAALRQSVEALGFEDASVQTWGPADENSFLIRVGRVALMTDADVQRVVQAVEARFPGKVKTWSFNAESGDKIDFEFTEPPPLAELKAAVEGAGVGVREVREEQGISAGSKSYAVITQGIRDRIERELTSRMQDASPEVRRVEYVGPSVGRELRNQGFKAILYAMALIVVYVGFRFDFRFAPGVILAILHNAIVTLGYYGFTGREFNLTSIAVILTVVGYQVNDTVVVYDRVRENQAKHKGMTLTEIVNLSINEVLGRTALTGISAVLALVGLLFYGVGTIFDFAMALFVGTLVGTYSTWYVAAPMTIWLEERTRAKKGAPSGAAARASK